MNKRFKLVRCFALAIVLTACTTSGGSSKSNNSKPSEEVYHTVKFEAYGHANIPDQKVLHGEKVSKPSNIYVDDAYGCWVYIDKQSLTSSELEEFESLEEEGGNLVSLGIRWFFDFHKVECDMTLYYSLGMKRKGSSSTNSSLAIWND